MAFIEEHLDMEPAMFYKHAQNLEGYIHLAKKRKLRFFLLHIQLYVNPINHQYNRLNTVIAAYRFVGEEKIAQDLNKLSSIVLNVTNTGEEALGTTN